MEYVTSVERDGKKVYTITDKGKEFLAEQEEVIDKIKCHMHDFWDTGNRREFREVFREMRGITQLMGKKAHRMSSDKLTKIRGIITKACHDVEKVIESEE
jgi:DNA-binding PadR family transcriptional regulator